MLNTWATTPTRGHARPCCRGRRSSSSISSMIVPASPRRMLAASLVAASMDPLGVWIAHLRGLPVPSVAEHVRPAAAELRLRASWRWCRRTCCSGLGRRLREAQELGSYQLVELLGRGGMGEVWRAEHRLLARSAAIKLVRPGGARRQRTQPRHDADAPALRARGAGDRRAELAAHDSRLRLRRHRRRHLLLRDGAAGRPRPRVAGARVRAAAGRTARSSCCGRCATRWPTRTPAASSIATSSRRTSTSAGWGSSTTSSRCSTSAWSSSTTSARRAHRRC